jgi:hypothetical protein
MTHPDDLPPWLFAHVQKCRDAFGIGGTWPVSVTLADCIDGDPAVHGCAVTNYQNLHAALTFRRDLDPAADGLITVTHECLHASQGPQFAAIDRILDLVPKRLRKHAAALWQDGNEQTLEAWARALTPLLQAMEYTAPSEEREA